jgi:hypothetical protein
MGKARVTRANRARRSLTGWKKCSTASCRPRSRAKPKSTWIRPEGGDPLAGGDLDERFAERRQPKRDDSGRRFNGALTVCAGMGILWIRKAERTSGGLALKTPSFSTGAEQNGRMRWIGPHRGRKPRRLFSACRADMYRLHLLGSAAVLSGRHRASRNASGHWIARCRVARPLFIPAAFTTSARMRKGAGGQSVAH